MSNKFRISAYVAAIPRLIKSFIEITSFHFTVIALFKISVIVIVSVLVIATAILSFSTKDTESAKLLVKALPAAALKEAITAPVL